jgi:hypothetical protein
LSLSDIFKPLKPPAANAPANAPCDGPSTSEGSSIAGSLVPLDNTYAMSSDWLRVDGLVANNIMQDEGEFDHYHKQIMDSRDPNYEFFVPDNSTAWQY